MSYFRPTAVFTAMLSILFFTGITTSLAQVVRAPRAGVPGTWRLLGTVSARHTADHDNIVVAGPYDYFRAIKFKVTDAPLHIIRMVVTYDGGAPQNIAVRYDIPQGGESRVIDLVGGKRKLRSVEFWYETKGFLNSHADVTLFGIK